ncbi:hypothetical protein [Candidatus Binatus sp.]|uniref:hypothetical protein n=1 Tax=Candidatus Binatus sp. TaxID=2811406 RepID=UPI003BB04BC7
MRRNLSRLVDVLLDRGRFTRTESIAIAVASITFALVFCYPLVFHLPATITFNDWDFVTAAQFAAYWTVHQYHQFPLWNPYECGGIPLLGDPQSHFLSPLFFLTILFGPWVGLHMELILYSAIAWAGGYVLGRVLGLRRISAICTATAFAGSSWFFLRAAEGQIVLVVLVYLPWIIAAGWKASERGMIRYTALCGALLALSFLEGSPYVPLYEGLMLALVLGGRAVVRLSIRPLIALTLAAVFLAGFGAAKGLPAVQVMISHPRPTNESWANTFDALRTALLSRNQDHNRSSLNGWGFWESGAYVSLFGAVALLSLVSPRKSLPWIIAAVVMFHLARGWTGPNSAWVWLHRMPVFSSTRLPSRLLIPFELAVAVLAGLGIDVLCSRGSPAALVLSALLVTIGAVDMLVVGSANLHYPLLSVASPGPTHGEFAQSLRPPAVAQSAVIRDHQGVVNCYTGMDWPTHAKGWNEPGYRGEQYLLGPGTVTLARWSPNRLEYAVDGPGPSMLVINQNYDPSWRVTSGSGRISSEDGLLTVRVPAGKSRIVLRYISIAAIWGMIITILTALVAFVLIRWESRRAVQDSSP